MTSDERVGQLCIISYSITVLITLEGRFDCFFFSFFPPFGIGRRGEDRVRYLGQVIVIVATVAIIPKAKEDQQSRSRSHHYRQV